MSKSTAILIFTQEASKEAARKMLTPSKNQGVNRLVFDKLNHFVERTATAAASKAENLQVFHSNQLIKPNSNSFGQQLSAAIQVVFERGFEKVICIGNDCPALNENRILAAAEKLQTVDTVVGPDNRGGAYLIGISSKDFNAEVFENLAWQSEKMLESFIEQYTNQAVLMLETLSDIHNFQELQTYTTSRYFIAFLIRLVEQVTARMQGFYSFFVENWSIRSLSLRAPPFV
ncbi:hypothetical protein GCM10011514_26810 [Emticicia aquatilis]|uniref:DUF2064 domain-containing protein n=1 Tax=Emticicia aquatilis TaxID=1537369 RepID=A0A917DS00_9BACT|nr:DUF2064 domain-containing protein [Emticicia aquatilis]GGD61403.1 hypothetical protein GCM10011514_26810 [Emticicia aquatilis]